MKVYINSNSKIRNLYLLLLLAIPFASCEDYLEVDPPVNQIPADVVFESPGTATAAVTTLYANLRDRSFLNGSYSGLGVQMGLYADDLSMYTTFGGFLDTFYHHQIIASDPTVADIWDEGYRVIYQANAAIEGLKISESLDSDLKNQLIGESLFVRAFSHFYLTSLFGDIPYIKVTDYTLNMSVSRLPVQEVMTQIIADLLEAKPLLSANYPNTERTRANKMVASALLARVYLYAEQWNKAEDEADALINNGTYTLEDDLNNEFLRGSSSAILQLTPKRTGSNTDEGLTYIFESGPPPILGLNPDFVEAMEDGDLRREKWIRKIENDGQEWYHAYKYKLNMPTGSSEEYAVVFRLAEQYLIRAEARAKTGNLAGAIEDINKIRSRSGLLPTVASSPQELQEAILKERFSEFFTEYGHRWFDLKRTGKAAHVLAPIKPNWRNNQLILPIPEKEILQNPNLQPQNPEY